MARRKKARLTLTKTSKKKAHKEAPGGLSERKFLALTHDYGSCVVENAFHESQIYKLEEDVYIQYKESAADDGSTDTDPTEEYWIGKIRNIRADSPNDVYVQVQWYWAPHEVAEVIKSFDPTKCGKYEKLISNNFDIISVHCIAEHVNVKYFDETGIYQEPIDDGEWFYRYEFLYDGRKVTPKVTHLACPICKVPYVPGTDKILHFCPRPNCLKFYHQACLVKHGYVEKTRKHRVLETWPDVDRTVPLEDFETHPGPPKKKQRRNHATPRKNINESIAGLPEELLKAANQQIIRGAQGSGVVGNTTPVCAARRLIWKTLNEGGVLSDDWEKHIDISGASVETDEQLPNCTCPSCYSPI
ncbi:hypothetical protein JVU11DRAFT_6126 [Chiua virens]|nr:hypothetical protein JVU11DRAFT_6126 [Chiua virens]